MAAESNVQTYTSDFLVGQRVMLELSNAYESKVGWNYVAYSEYNGVVETADGYLTTVMPKDDVSEKATAVARLAHLRGENDMPFLYVSVPHKVCPYEDPDLAGVIDFSNQNFDELLASLGADGVSVCDLRTLLHDEGLSHHELFYRTDHHWLPSTGMWAAHRLAEELNARMCFIISSPR